MTFDGLRKRVGGRERRCSRWAACAEIVKLRLVLAKEVAHDVVHAGPQNVHLRTNRKWLRHCRLRIRQKHQLHGYLFYMLKTDNIVITPDLLNTIAKIDEFKGYWRGTPALDPTVASSLKSAALQLDIKSTLALSGYDLLDEELLDLKKQKNWEHVASDSIRLAAGIHDVLVEASKHQPTATLSERHIQDLHQLLVAHLLEDQKCDAGAYWANSYRYSVYDDNAQEVTSEIIHQSLPEKKAQMAYLVNWLAQQNSGHQLHPLLVAAIVWATFLHTRPFRTGNEVLSYALTTMILARAGYGFIRYDALSSLLHDSSDEFRRALKSATDTVRSDDPNWQSWLLFFVQAMKRLTTRLPDKVESAQKALAEHPIVAQQILQLLRERGRATISDVARLTGQNRNTVKHHLHALKVSAKIRILGAGRGASYQLPEESTSKDARQLR